MNEGEREVEIRVPGESAEEEYREERAQLQEERRDLAEDQRETAEEQRELDQEQQGMERQVREEHAEAAQERVEEQTEATEERVEERAEAVEERAEAREPANPHTGWPAPGQPQHAEGTPGQHIESEDGHFHRTVEMPVLATVNRIERELRAQGFEVGATLNLSRQARQTRRTPGTMNQILPQQPAGQQQGEVRDARLIVFTHPEITRQILERSPMAVIDMPSAILVYEGSEGQTMVVYRDADEALDDDFDTQAGDLDDKLSQALNSALRTERATAVEPQQQPAYQGTTGERGT